MKYGSFEEALEFINGSREALSLSSAAFIRDVLHEVDNVDGIKQRCDAVLVEHCSGEWVQSTPLRDLMIVAGMLYKYNRLDGGQLALVVKRLLSAESRVGGPYKNERDEVDLETNIAVAYFARAAGITLPNVEEYVLRKAEQLSSVQYFLAYGKLPELSQRNCATIEEAAIALAYWHTDEQPVVGVSEIGLYDEIMHGIEEQLATLHQPLHTAAHEVYEKIRRADKNREIALMPTFFGECLKEAPDTSFYVPLGRANFYIWMAYTVYDDFLDREGKARYLPVAHMAVREAFRQYMPIARKNTQFAKLLSEVLTGMDEANAWEVGYCRFEVDGNQISINALPKYGRRTQLAARSFAHALGPLALVAQQWSLTSREMKYIKEGFKHYLIARQLDDDAHDWLDDIQAGQVSFVVAHILRQLRVRPGEYDLRELLARMKRHFWRYSAEQICNITLQHIQLAKKAFRASGIVELNGQFAGLLAKIEKSAKQTRARQVSERKFMDIYKASDA